MFDKEGFCNPFNVKLTFTLDEFRCLSMMTISSIFVRTAFDEICKSSSNG